MFVAQMQRGMGLEVRRKVTYANCYCHGNQSGSCRSFLLMADFSLFIRRASIIKILVLLCWFAFMEIFKFLRCFLIEVTVCIGSFFVQFLSGFPYVACSTLIIAYYLLYYVGLRACVGVVLRAASEYTPYGVPCGILLRNKTRRQFRSF